MVACCRIDDISGKLSNVGQSKIIGDVAADGYLGAHINENTDSAINQIRVLPNGVANVLPGPVLGGFHFGQFEEGKKERQQNQDDREEVHIELDDGVLR